MLWPLVGPLEAERGTEGVIQTAAVYDHVADIR